MKRALVAALALASTGALFAAGCWFELRPWRDGYVTVQWTIDGSRTASACSRRGAEHARIRVLDAWERTDTIEVSSCDAFEDTLGLVPGSYRAAVTLLDANEHAVASTVETEWFTVVRRSTTYVSIDIPTCAPIPLVYPYCPDGVVVERLDDARCVVGYECLVDGGAYDAGAAPVAESSASEG